MGTFSPLARSLKQTLLNFLSRCSRTKRSSTRTASKIRREESLKSPPLVYHTNEVSELPSADTMTTLSSWPPELASDEPGVAKGMNSREDFLFSRK